MNIIENLYNYLQNCNKNTIVINLHTEMLEKYYKLNFSNIWFNPSMELVLSSSVKC